MTPTTSTATSTRGSEPGDLVDIAVVVVALQAAVLAASTLEGLVFALGFGPAAMGGALLGGLALGATLLVALGLHRRSRRARTIALLAEGAIVVVAVIDLLLALVLAGAALVPVAILTRLAAPLAVVALLRRKDVRGLFAPNQEVGA